MSQHTDNLPIDTRTPVTRPVPDDVMSREPVVTVTMITTFVSATFAVIVLAFPGIDPQWEKVILGLIAAAWPIVTATWARSRAYSPATTQSLSNAAAVSGEAADVAPPPPTKQAKGKATV